MQKLERCKPEEAGVSSRSVIYFLEALERARIPLHSLMIIRNGRVAAEVYYEPYEKICFTGFILQRKASRRLP